MLFQRTDVYGLTYTGDGLNVFKRYVLAGRRPGPLLHRPGPTGYTIHTWYDDDTTADGTVFNGTTWLGVVPSSDTLCQSNRELTRETVL